MSVIDAQVADQKAFPLKSTYRERERGGGGGGLYILFFMRYVCKKIDTHRYVAAWEILLKESKLFSKKKITGI
jgi:hypothetical protein